MLFVEQLLQFPVADCADDNSRILYLGMKAESVIREKIFRKLFVSPFRIVGRSRYLKSLDFHQRFNAASADRLSVINSIYAHSNAAFQQPGNYRRPEAFFQRPVI